MADWRKQGFSWQSGLPADPNSPSGSGGPGMFRTPGAMSGHTWPGVMPHPEAPDAKRVATDLPGWDILERLKCVKAAADQSVEFMPDAILKETGYAIHELVEGFIPALVIGIAVIALSTGVGAGIGAIIGAFFGGAGALPGAAGGAAVGFEVGVWLVNLLGIGFLLIYLKDNLGEVVDLADRAVTNAWYAPDTPDLKTVRIRQAAQDLAQAVGVLWKVILQAIVAYLISKGVKSASKQVPDLIASLRRSRLGQRFAAWIEKNWQALVEDPKLQPKKKSPGVGMEDEPGAAGGGSGGGTNNGGTGGSSSGGSGTSSSGGTGGQYRDANGRLRNADGTFAKEPATTPVRYNRNNQYPHGNTKTVRDQVIAKHTDAKGNVIDPETGQIIPKDQVTIEHKRSVVDHWNKEGYNQTQAERNAWFNDPDNLSVKPKSANSSEGATVGQTYRQDVGPDYKP